MGLKLIIPDSVVLKLQYEIENFQADDIAYDIAQSTIEDDVWDLITYGYLLSTLENLDNSFGGRELLEEFKSFIDGVRK